MMTTKMMGRPFLVSLSSSQQGEKNRGKSAGRDVMLAHRTSKNWNHPWTEMYKTPTPFQYLEHVRGTVSRGSHVSGAA